MAELKKNRVLLFVLLMIFPAQSLDVIFSNALDDFKQKSEINTYTRNGENTYAGTSNQLSYRPEADTSKVIVYIIDRSRFVEIIRNAVREARLQIAQTLGEWHYELVFLGIDNFDDNEYHLISAFMADKIQRLSGQTNVTIETMGEHHFDRIYHCTILDNVLHTFEKYQENAQICGGTLKERLRSISRGALRPVGSNGKEIRLYGLHPAVKEVAWTVGVVNGIYFPEVNVSDPKYNFRLRYKTKKICLLILRRKEYTAVTSHGRRSTLKESFSEILDKMTENNEGLIILGVFNFEWTEMDVVTQIILKHSERCERFDYNIFTYGYGMFNSKYRNVYVRDGRNILSQPKSNVTELISELMGGEVKERAIKMYYSSYGWKELEIPIKLDNGQYVTAGRFKNYTFPWVNQKIAFIVYDATEKNVPIDIRMVYLSMEELKQSGIYVAVIEAINFGLDDMHIIAEWIDYHRGVRIQNSAREIIDSEQIAVLGGGMFETIFQSKKTTYKTLFNTKKNELKAIRNAVAKSTKTKYVFAAQIDNSNFEVWTYSMNTINGFHEPDLIPDKNMFDTTNGRKILFLIASANCFQQISTLDNMKSIERFRKKIEIYYPSSDWSVFLVGLDNFGERDYHLFAELVKVQTHDERSLQEFVRTFDYGIGPSVYQYRDTEPFLSVDRLRCQWSITTFFESTCRLPGGTSSQL